MAQRNDRTSLRRPLVMGAVLLVFLFVVAVAVAARIGGEKVAESARRDQLTQSAATARRQGIDTARRLADELRIHLDDARQAAELICREAVRDIPDPAVLPGTSPAGAAGGVPVAGTGLHFVQCADAGVFAVAEEGDSDAGLRGWVDRLAPVLRSALDREAGVARASVAIDGVGLVGAPEAWAVRAAEEPAAAAAIERDLRDADGPRSAGWVVADGPRLVYAMPVVGPDGARVGTARVEFAAEALVAPLDAAAVRPDTGAVLLSSTGRPLASSAGFAFALGAGAPGVDVDTALHPFVGAVGVFYPPPDGHHVVADGRRFAAVGLDGTPFSVGVVGPSALPDFEEPGTVAAVRQLGLVGLGLCMAFGLAALLGTFHLVSTHRRRMRVVLDGIEAHERGQYLQTVEIQGDDDAAEFARWMNTANVRLRQSALRADETERRLNGLIDSIGDGFITTDADDRIVHVNQRFADLLRRHAPSITGRYVEELLAPDSIERFRANVGRRRERRPARFEVVWNSPRTPHPRTILSCVPLFDDAGRPCGGWIVVTDLTDKVRVHEEIARAEKIRALGEMAGGVAHDFNNILTVVLGNAQYLLLDDLEGEQLETLRTIERAALEGTESVRRIREFTRSRTVAANADFVDPNALLDDVMSAARRRFEEAGRARGVEFKVVVERCSRRRMRGNAPELREALANVVENAFEAMPQGGTLTVETFDRGEDAIAIRIEDTGVGMAPDVQKKIFDPFFTTKETGRCPGLGLSIAFGIVRAHRGRIDVKSEAGAGSTFTIVLQAAAGVSDPRAIETASPSASSSSSTHVVPRVLLVGAESTEMNCLLSDLRGLGVYATTVHPASAHALVCDPTIFNTLVVEFDLGAHSGWELARQARASRADLRILLVTTPANPVSETQARNAGIDLVLVAPFDARDLHAEIFALVAAPRVPIEAPLPASVRARQAPARPRDDGDGAKTCEIWSAGNVRPAGAAGDAADGGNAADSADDATETVPPTEPGDDDASTNEPPSP